MTFTQLCGLASQCIFWPAFGLYFTGYLSRKRLNFYVCIAFGMSFFEDASRGRHVVTTIDALLSLFYYYQWKKCDDDDEPKNKRRALVRSAYDKVLPKPKTRPAPVA